MKFYILRSQGVVAPMDVATLQFRRTDQVEITVNTTVFRGLVSDLEIVEEAEILNIINALKSGVPYHE